MKSLLTYLVLVGTPLAGLVGILHAGSRLEAPASVGGTWRVESPAAPGDPVLRVSQSGVHAEVILGGARMRGEVRGDSLFAAAAGAERAPAGPCGSAPGRALRARIDRVSEPDRMTGVVSVPARPECAAPVRAVRVPALKRGGAH